MPSGRFPLVIGWSLYLCGCALFAWSFFLPVVHQTASSLFGTKEETTLGWETFHQVMTKDFNPKWPSRASALTNFLVPLPLFALCFRLRRTTLALTVLLGLVALFNLGFWSMPRGPGPPPRWEIGFHCWWFSFAVMASGLAVLGQPPSSARPDDPLSR